ncbi:hypothetical protein ACFLU3_03020 [Chloroflexota bacterium]
MFKTCWQSVFVLVIVLSLSISVGGCGSSDDDGKVSPPDIESLPSQTTIIPVDSPQLPDSGFYKGFASLLPTDDSFENSYKKAAEHAQFANIWVGSPDSGYWNLAEYLDGSWGDNFVGKFARENDIFPIINLSFIDKDPSSGKLILRVPKGKNYSSLSDPAFREAYKKGAIDAVKVSKPLYFSVGNEINRWYEQYGANNGDPNGFEHFVSLYEEIYDTIKELSPETKVFCIFAREIVDENREADLSVLEMFNPNKLDILAFTSYPFAPQNISKVSDIPNDYYSRALNHLGMNDMPFGLTELTWSTMDFFGGEAAQADFLTDAAGRLTTDQGMNLHLLGWWSLYDLEGDPHGTGLIARDGRKKPAYEVWKNL